MADNTIKTPVERLFDNLETNIAEFNQDIARKTEEINSLKQEIQSARERNQGVLTVCCQQRQIQIGATDQIVPKSNRN